MSILLKNGKIYLEENRFTDALFIDCGRIISIGEEATAMRTPDEVYDLKGKTVLPGFNDAHLHLASVGEFLTACDLTSANSIDSLIDLGKKYLQNKPSTFLYGMGWNQDHFEFGERRLPNRWDLDQISKDIPIVYARTCGHLAVGNSKAIDLLRIDAETSINGGEIIRNESSIPTGVFTENAVKFLYTVLPPKTEQDWERHLKAGIEYAIENGITSVQSCDVLRNDIDIVFETLHKMKADGSLKLRYHHQFNFQNITDFEKYLETEFKNPNYDTDFLSRGTLKLFKDGSLGARTAHLSTPYCDSPGQMGVQALSDAELDRLCQLAAAHDIQVITHAIGDAAIQSVLDAYVKTFDERGNYLRHAIVHCQITSANQLEQIAEHNIPAIVQPIFIDYDTHIVNDRVGPALASTSYAFKTLSEKGVSVSFSTDAPVEDLNPFRNLYCAITRKPLNGAPIPLNEKEALSVSQAIDAYTLESAYAEFKETYKGRLKPGFYADLIVLDKDIFEIDPEEIPTVSVLKTMINGEWQLMGTKIQ